jgi:Condensation domain
LFIVAPASFAQARFWLDEQIRFQPDRAQVAIYNMPFLYHLSSKNALSVTQLQYALQLIVNKHQSLRTSLIFDSNKNLLMQRVVNQQDSNNNLFPITESVYETDKHLIEIMHKEKGNSQLFDLSQGLVFRCHIVYYKQISPNNLLFDKDALIFNFHHALFDYPSMDLFLHDLNQAYSTNQLATDDETNLRYLDCKYQT